MRRMVRENPSGACCGKLTEADFENIWLRVKDRALKLVVAAIAAIGVGGFAAGYYWARLAVDSQMERFLSGYVKGEAFKAQVSSALVTGTSELRDERLAAEKTLKELQRRAVNLDRPGISITDQAVSLTAADGRSFRVERGTLRSGGSQKVVFSRPFAKPPIVLVDADYGNLSLNYERRRLEALSELRGMQGSAVPRFMMVPSTESGFEVRARYMNAVPWIAIGW